MKNLTFFHKDGTLQNVQEGQTITKNPEGGNMDRKL